MDRKQCASGMGMFNTLLSTRVSLCYPFAAGTSPKENPAKASERPESTGDFLLADVGVSRGLVSFSTAPHPLPHVLYGNPQLLADVLEVSTTSRDSVAFFV